MSGVITDQVESAIRVAQQYAALAGAVASPFLSAKQAAAVNLASDALALLMQSIEQQADIDDVSFASLDAQEALILTADAKAQADAQTRAVADLRAGEG